MSVSDTLAERGKRYGEFADHARIAQGIQDVMRAAPKWDSLDHDMKQALSVIADKIARILNGDPFYVDNWHDLSGYATLIERRLNQIVDEPQELFSAEEPKATLTLNDNGYVNGIEITMTDGTKYKQSLLNALNNTYVVGEKPSESFSIKDGTIKAEKVDVPTITINADSTLSPETIRNIFSKSTGSSWLGD